VKIEPRYRKSAARRMPSLASIQIPAAANKNESSIPHIRDTCTAGKTHHHIATILSARELEMLFAGSSSR